MLIIGTCYFSLQFVFNYRIGILAFIDRIKKDYKSKVISRDQRMNIDDLFIRKYKIIKVKAIYCKRTKVFLRLVMIDNMINNFTNKEKAKIANTLNGINKKL